MYYFSLNLNRYRNEKEKSVMTIEKNMLFVFIHNFYFNSL